MVNDDRTVLTNHVAPVEILRWFYSYNDWSRPQVIRAVSRATDEQIRRPKLIVGGSDDGSIFSALTHIVDAEDTWLARWMGIAETIEPDPVIYATLESTAKHWAHVNETRDAWLASLSVADLEAPSRAYAGADGQVTTVPLWPMLFHVLNHTAHHRSEIFEALTKLGLPPEQASDVMDCVRDRLGVVAPFTGVPVPSGDPD